MNRATLKQLGGGLAAAAIAAFGGTFVSGDLGPVGSVLVRWFLAALACQAAVVAIAKLRALVETKRLDPYDKCYCEVWPEMWGNPPCHLLDHSHMTVLTESINDNPLPTSEKFNPETGPSSAKPNTGATRAAAIAAHDNNYGGATQSTHTAVAEAMAYAVANADPTPWPVTNSVLLAGLVVLIGDLDYSSMGQPDVTMLCMGMIAGLWLVPLLVRTVRAIRGSSRPNIVLNTTSYLGVVKTINASSVSTTSWLSALVAMLVVLNFGAAPWLLAGAAIGATTVTFGFFQCYTVCDTDDMPYDQVCEPKGMYVPKCMTAMMLSWFGLNRAQAPAPAPVPAIPKWVQQMPTGFQPVSAVITGDDGRVRWQAANGMYIVTNANPATVNPATVNPATVNPATVEPATVKPATVEPATVEPATVEPATVKPATVNPATVEPATVKPATVNPATVEPATVKPATVNPATAEPATVNPATVNPAIAESATK